MVAKWAFIFIGLIFMINPSLVCINLMLHHNKEIFNIDAMDIKKTKIGIFLNETS